MNDSTRQKAAVMLLRAAKAVSLDRYCNPAALTAIGLSLTPLVDNVDGAESVTARRLVLISALTDFNGERIAKELDAVTKVGNEELFVIGRSGSSNPPDGEYVVSPAHGSNNHPTLVRLFTLENGRRAWQYSGQTEAFVTPFPPVDPARMTRVATAPGPDYASIEKRVVRQDAQDAISGVLAAINEFQDGDAATLAVIADSFYDAAKACAAMLDSHRDACLSPRVRHLRDQLKLVRIVD